MNINNIVKKVAIELTVLFVVLQIIVNISFNNNVYFTIIINL